MKHEGPYREMPDQDTAAIEKMEKEIRAEGKEGKISIQLPENIKIGDAVPLFADALKKNKIDPKDIIFYSLATGILKYNRENMYSGGGIIDRVIKKDYIYTSKNDPYAHLTITVEKNKAKFAAVTTKEDSKKIKEGEEKKDWYKTLLQLGDGIRKMKKLIKDKDRVNPELEEKYTIELSDLKNSLESLLHAINDKLEAEK